MKWLPRGPDRSVRSQLAIVLTLALIASLTVIVPALAAHEEGEFELDKNATNDLTVTPVGYLASNIDALAESINVCQTGSAPDNGDTILMRSERMTVTANTAGSFGGNCPGEKRTYMVTRGVDGTTAISQSSGANNIGARISLLETETKDGVDWDQVHSAYTGGDDDCSSIGLAACVYVFDDIGPSTFTVGSTKDHLPLEGWFHTSGASPDKAEILNAYAAKAIADDDDDQLLYFGMDRYAVDGSTDIGFWFFQDEVFACPDPDAGDACDGVPDGEFAGTHIAGDLLVLSTFTEGGAQSDIRVFTWVDSGGSEQANIDAVTSGDYGDCVDASLPAGDAGCATVNNTTIEAPWDNNYQFKGAATGGWMPAGGFFEGGVNLSEAGLDGCFSSFLAETRSSPEITAILKDFALGAFEACDSELTTQPRDGAGAVIDDSDEDGLIDVVIGTGSTGVLVTDAATLTINGISEWSGTLDFYLCGPIADPGVCDTGGVLVTDDLAVDQDTSQPIVSDTAKLTEVGRYCWRAEFDSATEGVPDATDSTLANECFEVLPVTPVLTTTAWSTGDSSGSAVTTPQPFGTTLYDKANLTGTAYQPGTDGQNATYPSINATMDTAAGGSITFTLVDQTACDATDPVAGSSGSNPEAGVTVSGDGNYFSSGFVPNSPGDYTWQASYTGDSPNTLSTSHNDACDETAEHVSVLQLNPAISTAQSFVPNDAATITVASGAGALAGSVLFELYVNDSDCSETAAYTSSSIDITSGTGDDLSRTVMSSNTTAYATDGTTFHWKVTYTSTNPAHTGVTSSCGTEISSITINNNAGS